MFKWIQLGVGVLLLVILAGVGYRLAASRVETDIYRQRLSGLTGEYESLRSTYNQAVRRTAVTELLVRGGKLSVAIRTIEGVDRLIETPFDPSREIYCDYVLVDGRLWIRRVYDNYTPPYKGQVIDERFASVDWNAPNAREGKAAYRSLSEGRWVVTVTGDGALALVKADDKTPTVLSGPPPVRDYDQIEKQIADQYSHVTFGEVVRRIFGASQ